MNELKSYTEYAVSTPTADFVIGFDFNYGEDAVNVTVDDVPATAAGYTVVYLNETTIQLSPSVPSGVVRLQRETDIDTTDNQFTAGAKFTAQTMDENFEQLRHSQQEVRDGFSKLAASTSLRLDTFSGRVDDLNNAFLTTQGVVADLVTTSETTVTTANTALNTANAIDAKASTALSNSSTALSTATGIDAKATDALDNSLTAVLDSSAALNTANAIDGKATQALTDSATALSSATTALNTANAVDGKATQALTNSTGALKSSNNLSDVVSATTARANLGVMSSSEVATAINTATPPASTTTLGVVRLANSLTSAATDQALTAAQGRVLNLRQFGQWGTSYFNGGALNTVYTHSEESPLLLTVVATIATAGTTLQIQSSSGLVRGWSGSTVAGGKVSVTAVIPSGGNYKVVPVGAGTVTIDAQMLVW